METNFARISIVGFITQAVAFFALFFMPIYLKGLGFDGLEIGILMGVFSITAIFTYFAVGYANDVLTVRGVLIISLLMLAVFLIGISLTASFFALIILFLIGSIGKDFVRRSLENTALKISEKEKGKKLGTFILIITLGTTVGLLVGSFIAGVLDFKAAFIALAVLMILTIIPVWGLKNIPVAKIKISEYKSEIFRKKTLLFSALLFIFGLHYGAEYTSYTLFLKESLGLSIFNIGIYMAIPIAIYAITAYYFGKKIDKAWDHKKLFVAGILMSGIGHYFMVTPDLLISFMFRVLHEIGDGLFEITKLIWVSLMFSREKIGGSFGFVMTITMLGAFVGSLVFGPLGESMGYGLPLQISGVIIVAEALLLGAYLFFIRRKH